MKTISLTCHLLKSYFARNKAVFAVFLLSFMLLCFSLFLLYSIMVSYVASLNSTTRNDTFYNIILTEPVSYDEFSAMEKSCRVLGKTRSTLLRSAERVPVAEGKTAVLYGSRLQSGLLFLYTQEGRLFFTEEEASGKEPAAIASAMLGLRVGDRIDIGLSEPVTVVGIAMTVGDSLYIPEPLFAQTGLSVQDAEIIMPRRLSFPEIWELDRFNRSQERVADIYGVHKLQTELHQAVENLTGFTVLTLILFLFFLYIMQYITEKNRRTYAMFGMLGASRSDFAVLFLLERIVLTLIAGIPAALLHFLFGARLPQFVPFDTPSRNMRVLDYSVSLLLILLAVIAVSIPYMIAFLRKQYVVTAK